MNKKELISFYEKLYFHELELKEKIVARLQLPFAILLTLLGFLGYLLNGYASEGSQTAVYAFWVCFTVSVGLLATATRHFLRALWGHNYECLPDAKATDDFKISLEEYYDEASEASDGLDDYLLQYYRDCSASNTKVNDGRSLELHKAYAFITYSIAPLIATFLVFHFGDLDRSHLDKAANVNIVNPIKVEVNKVTDKDKQTSNTAKTPPSPPPKRIIKEDAPHKGGSKSGGSSNG